MHTGIRGRRRIKEQWPQALSLIKFRFFLLFLLFLHKQVRSQWAEAEVRLYKKKGFIRFS